MSELQVSQKRRFRGAILQFVYTNHEAQLAHYDHIMLWGLMQDLGFSLGQLQVITLLQELKDRGYLIFEERRNKLTGAVEISRIGITPAGRNLVEGIEQDAAVLVP